jgi:hypothetical protein
MKFNLRQLSPDDYDAYLYKWWTDWGWQPPAKEFLPENGAGGLIVEENKTPVCAGFIYVTNSQVAWVDWIISNKEYNNKENRKKAIDLLIESLTNVCKMNGNKYVYALIKHKNLMEVYKKHGYIVGDQYNQEMIKGF